MAGVATVAVKGGEAVESGEGDAVISRRGETKLANGAGEVTPSVTDRMDDRDEALSTAGASDVIFAAGGDDVLDEVSPTSGDGMSDKTDNVTEVAIAFESSEAVLVGTILGGNISDSSNTGDSRSVPVEVWQGKKSETRGRRGTNTSTYDD